MNTAIAVTADLCRTAVILAGIWAGRGFLIALAPQLRVTAPQKGQQPPADGEAS